jgi:hypothetical protein
MNFTVFFADVSCSLLHEVAVHDRDVHATWCILL